VRVKDTGTAPAPIPQQAPAPSRGDIENSASRGPWRPGRLGVLLLLTGCSWLGEHPGLTSLLGVLRGDVLLQRLPPIERGSSQALDRRRELALLFEVVPPLFCLSVGMRLEVDTMQPPSVAGSASLGAIRRPTRIADWWYRA
jgi:hypothetical protein